MATLSLSIAELANQLLVLPETIEQAEKEALEASHALDRAKHALALHEASLFAGKQITGTNEAERKRQVLMLSLQEQARVNEAQEAYDWASLRLRTLHTRHASLRNVARLMGGRE